RQESAPDLCSRGRRAAGLQQRRRAVDVDLDARWPAVGAALPRRLCAAETRLEPAAQARASPCLRCGLGTSISLRRKLVHGRLLIRSFWSQDDRWEFGLVDCIGK